MAGWIAVNDIANDDNTEAVDLAQSTPTNYTNDGNASSTTGIDIGTETAAPAHSGEGDVAAIAKAIGEARTLHGMKRQNNNSNSPIARRASAVLHPHGGFSIVMKPVAHTGNAPPNVISYVTNNTSVDAASLYSSEPMDMSSSSLASRERSEPGDHCPSMGGMSEDEELRKADRTRTKEVTEEESQEKENLSSRGLTQGMTLTRRELRALLDDSTLYPGGMVRYIRDDERRLREALRGKYYSSRPMPTENSGDKREISRALVSSPNQPMDRKSPHHSWNGTSPPAQRLMRPPCQMSHGPQRSHWDDLSAIESAMLEDGFKVAEKAGQLPNKAARQKFAKDMNVTFEAISYWFCKRQGCEISRLGKHQCQSTSPPSQMPVEASGQTTNGPPTSRTYAEIRFSPVQKAILEYTFMVEGKLPSKEVRQNLANDMYVTYGRVNNWFNKRSQLEKRTQEQAAKKISDSAAIKDLDPPAHGRSGIELDHQHGGLSPSRRPGGCGHGYGNGTSDRNSMWSPTAISLRTSCLRHRYSNFDEYGTKDRDLRRRVLWHSDNYRSPLMPPERPHQNARSKYVPAKCMLRGGGGTDSIYGGNVSGNPGRPDYTSQPTPPRTPQMGSNDCLCDRIPSSPNVASNRGQSVASAQGAPSSVAAAAPARPHITFDGVYLRRPKCNVFNSCKESVLFRCKDCRCHMCRVCMEKDPIHKADELDWTDYDSQSASKPRSNLGASRQPKNSLNVPPAAAEIMEEQLDDSRNSPTTLNGSSGLWCQIFPSVHSCHATSTDGIEDSPSPQSSDSDEERGAALKQSSTPMPGAYPGSPEVVTMGDDGSSTIKQEIKQEPGIKKEGDEDAKSGDSSSGTSSQSVPPIRSEYQEMYPQDASAPDESRPRGGALPAEQNVDPGDADVPVEFEEQDVVMAASDLATSYQMMPAERVPSGEHQPESPQLMSERSDISIKIEEQEVSMDEAIALWTGPVASPKGSEQDAVMTDLERSMQDVRMSGAIDVVENPEEINTVQLPVHHDVALPSIEIEDAVSDCSSSYIGYGAYPRKTKNDPDEDRRMADWFRGLEAGGGPWFPAEYPDWEFTTPEDWGMSHVYPDGPRYHYKNPTNSQLEEGLKKHLWEVARMRQEFHYIFREGRMSCQERARCAARTYGECGKAGPYDRASRVWVYQRNRLGYRTDATPATHKPLKMNFWEWNQKFIDDPFRVWKEHVKRRDAPEKWARKQKRDAKRAEDIYTASSSESDDDGDDSEDEHLDAWGPATEHEDGWHFVDRDKAFGVLPIRINGDGTVEHIKPRNSVQNRPPSALSEPPSSSIEKPLPVWAALAPHLVDPQRATFPSIPKPSDKEPTSTTGSSNDNRATPPLRGSPSFVEHYARICRDCRLRNYDRNIHWHRAYVCMACSDKRSKTALWKEKGGSTPQASEQTGDKGKDRAVNLDLGTEKCSGCQTPHNAQDRLRFHQGTWKCTPCRHYFDYKRRCSIAKTSDQIWDEGKDSWGDDDDRDDDYVDARTVDAWTENCSSCRKPTPHTKISPTRRPNGAPICHKCYQKLQDKGQIIENRHPCIDHKYWEPHQPAKCFGHTPASINAIFTALRGAKIVAFDLDHVLHDHLHWATLGACAVLQRIFSNHPWMSIEGMVETDTYVKCRLNSSAERPELNLLFAPFVGHLVETFVDKQPNEVQIDYEPLPTAEGGIVHRPEIERGRYYDLLRNWGRISTTQECVEFLAQYNHDMQQRAGFAPRKGAVEFLRALRMAGKKVVVVTRGDTAAQAETTSRLGIRNLFDGVIAEGVFAHIAWMRNVGKKIPLFGAAAWKFGMEWRVRPEDVLYLGYKQGEIIRAMNVGMRSLAFVEHDGRKLQLPLAIGGFSGFAELHEIFVRGELGGEDGWIDEVPRGGYRPKVAAPPQSPWRLSKVELEKKTREMLEEAEHIEREVEEQEKERLQTMNEEMERGTGSVAILEEKEEIASEGEKEVDEEIRQQSEAMKETMQMEPGTAAMFEEGRELERVSEEMARMMDGVVNEDMEDPEGIYGISDEEL